MYLLEVKITVQSRPDIIRDFLKQLEDDILDTSKGEKITVISVTDLDWSKKNEDINRRKTQSSS